MLVSAEYSQSVSTVAKWNKENLLRILDNPITVENKIIIYRMLQALYECQTQDEKQHGGTCYKNGAGFNGCDAMFLSSVAEGSKKWGGRLSDKQAICVAKKLRKYTGQLEKIAAAKLRERDAQRNAIVA